MFCSNCGKKVEDKAIVCVECGTPVKLSLTSDKKFMTTLLLCLFLGMFGVHRFYKGKKKTAIAQLILTCTIYGAVISGIWVLIDLIMIITGNFDASNTSNVRNASNIKSIKNNDKSFVATLLLCLFLGMVGAHRFYTCKIGTAIIQLILTCTGYGAFISGIWVLVDLIMILLGNFKTKDGKDLAK